MPLCLDRKLRATVRVHAEIGRMDIDLFFRDTVRKLLFQLFRLPENVPVVRVHIAEAGCAQRGEELSLAFCDPLQCFKKFHVLASDVRDDAVCRFQNAA